MSESLNLRMKPYIQPFERELAMRELGVLIGSSSATEQSNGDVRVPAHIAGQIIAQLAYWESVGESYTSQVHREAASLAARNGTALAELTDLSLARILAKVPRSRCLRYGPHGIHEYRGKFFPQLVLALMNIARVDGGRILDPMCGSGTTLVEAASSGYRAIGCDMNPLSVFISQVKCEALSLNPAAVVTSFDRLRDQLARRNVQGTPRIRPPADEAYVQRWFAGDVVRQLDAISEALERIDSPSVRRLFTVSLSNILRQVSHQKVADLRVRREVNNIEGAAVTEIFLTEALRTAKAITADLRHLGSVPRGHFEVHEADARSFVTSGFVGEGEIDLIITSPPYATALPYLDTDRLSLSYLGLLSRSDHRSRDHTMIGNREISNRLRYEQWDRYLLEGPILPKSVCAIIDLVERENNGGNVGFRRRNLPALLSNYFFDMRQVLVECQHALRSGGQAFFVVGNNRTRTPSGEVEIRTSELLLEIAADIGFIDCQKVEMEMLHSRDIFKDNRTPSEHILSFRRQ